MMRIGFLVMITFLLFSCKKDKLKGDKEIFIGKWKWVITKTLENSCGGGPEYYTYKDPISEGVNYSIEFLKCGKVVYYENNKETSKDRIVFQRFEVSTSSKWIGYYSFGIDGDNKNEKHIGGLVKSDTLVLIGNTKWPHFSEACPCCTGYIYFIRE